MKMTVEANNKKSMTQIDQSRFKLDFKTFNFENKTSKNKNKLFHFITVISILFTNII